MSRRKCRARARTPSSPAEGPFSDLLPDVSSCRDTNDDRSAAACTRTRFATADRCIANSGLIDWRPLTGGSRPFHGVVPRLRPQKNDTRFSFTSKNSYETTAASRCDVRRPPLPTSVRSKSFVSSSSSAPFGGNYSRTYIPNRWSRSTPRLTCSRRKRFGAARLYAVLSGTVRRLDGSLYLDTVRGGLSPPAPNAVSMTVATLGTIGR